MAWVMLAALAAGTYLLASTNLAILLARRLKGIDVRSLGPGTAGTANTARALGLGFAVLVFLFDLFKSMGPLFLARLLLLVAATAILGHCRPVFHGFRGGGGVVTAMGALFVIVPAEFLLSLVAGFVAVQVFLRGAQYRLGQWTPIVFLAITPVVTLAACLWVDQPLVAGVRFGGKPWPVAAGVLALGLLIMLLNPRHARDRVRELRRRARSPGEEGKSDSKKELHDG
jgi:acyl-phosphate glycerol 3-phosphate acyltransferase